MSKIDELIQQLCPDGVEYKPLKEVFNTRNGYTPSKKNPEYWETGGTVPWFRMEDIRENGRLLETSLQYVSESAVKRNGLMPKGSLIVATSATIGEHAMLLVDGLCNQRFTCLTVKQEYAGLISEKYVFYWGDVLDEFCKMNLNQGNFASVNMDAFSKCPFPIPPLEVQQEIVRILDAFTELEANLQRELDARKKQYDYYRDELIQQLCPDGVDYKPLGEIAELAKGSGLQKRDFADTGTGCIHYGQIHTRFDTYTDNVLSYVSDELAKKLLVVHPGDLIVAVTSEDVEGNCKAVAWLGDEDIVTGGHSVVIRHKLNSKYLSYCFQSRAFAKQKRRFAFGAKVVEMRTDNLAKIAIPVPSLEAQQKIVAKLDAMLLLQDNLQRQIDLTHRQYEHYRDMLLDLPKKES